MNNEEQKKIDEKDAHKTDWLHGALSERSPMGYRSGWIALVANLIQEIEQL